MLKIIVIDVLFFVKRIFSQIRGIPRCHAVSIQGALLRNAFSGQ